MRVKGKKFLTSLVMVVALFIIVFGQTITYAADDTIYVGISESKESGVAYSNGYPDGSPTSGKNIWDFVTYTDNTGSTRTSPQKNLYCVKAGVGFNNTSDVKEYSQKYDLRTQKSEIANLTVENYNSIAGTYYKNILCLLDNMYVPGESTESEKIALLQAAGIDTSEEEYINFPLTDDDIETIQQMAIWYFTNNGDGVHDIDSLDNLHIKDSSMSDYTSIDNYYRYSGEDKPENMQKLYTYILNYAKNTANTDKYTETTTTMGAPVTVSGASINVTEVDSTYNKVGPINITKNNNILYTLAFEVKDGNDSEISSSNYSFITENGTAISNINAATGDVYIKLPKTYGDNLSIKVTTNYNTIDATLWVSGSDHTLQPVIEPKRTPKTTEVTLTTTPSSPFDLALRKFITKVGATDVTDRVPSLRDWTLDGGTTLFKEHTKDPYKVKEGDLVEFTIRVYNEGGKSGYAQEITDYILNDTGLEFVPENTTNGIYGWKMYKADGTTETNNISEAKYLKTDYLSKSAGELASRDNLLAAYDGTTIDSRDIKVVFKVKYPENSRDTKTFVNIAAITADSDSDGNDVTDRDSTPGKEDTGTRPYPNPTYNTENHEDDIDYEPVELKRFDLALKKYISAVSSDATIQEGEYITDTGRSDGTYTRAPKVTAITNNTVTYQEHNKDPYSLMSGNYVLYTFRIYNEGEVDGYASLIRDSIPEGLEFVTTDTQYNGIWTYHPKSTSTDPLSTDVDTITTDWIAKGKGDELNSVEGETAYTANLLKALQTDASGNGTVSTTNPLNPDYREVQALFRVTEPNTSSRVLVNEAQIADDTDKDGNPITDDDSTPDEWKGEDDEDIEKVQLEIFDLSLRKYITAVGTSTSVAEGDTLEGTESRTPNIDTTTLESGTTATYSHKKDPVEVSKGSVVTYTITAYNEGTVDGYASEITDYIPEGLEFIPAGTSEGQSAINNTNGWKLYKWNDDRSALVETTDPSEARIIKTDTLKNQKLEKRYEATVQGKGPYGLNCYSVQVQLKVKDTAEAEKILTNIAEISEYRYKGNADTDIVYEDRDSQPDSLIDDNSKNIDQLPTDENLPSYNGGDDTNPTDNYIPGQQDDDDFEKVVIKPRVDLALTKFIIAISNDATIDDGEYLTADGHEGSKTNPYTRATAVNTNPLLQGGHDAIYTQVKTPLTIANNSYILYNIRVYNEGEVDVIAAQIKDYLPDGIEFVEGEFNSKHAWRLDEDGKTVITEYLDYVTKGGIPHAVTEDGALKAFDKTTDQGAGEGLDYRDLPILCRVNNSAQTGVKLVNSAEITRYLDKDGNELPKDIDSTPSNLPDEDKNKEGKPEGRYNEDDEDYEVVLIKKVDLALTKFITAISSDTNIEESEYLKNENGEYIRQTAVDTNPLKNGQNDAIYTQVKEPALNVNRGYYVLYNIRVYNEGQVDVYAGEVTDYLPENLEFVDGDFNKQYGWEANGQTVKTSYLKYVAENKGTDKDQILKAFDSANDNGAGSGLDFKDLPILCRVSEKTESGKALVNIAEVTKYEDEEGNPLPNDVDSTPENVDEKNEDDDDYEQVIVEEFDLSLLKYVSKVIVTEDGQTSTTETHNTGNNETDIIPKVEIHRKKLNTTSVSFVYTIRITNEGDIAGYAKEITDYVPEGLAFYTEDNASWTVKGDGVIATRALEDKLLQPGESADVQVTFRWINGANNLNLKRNTAEISEDYNEKGIPDRDSTPNNKKDGEDDIDIADVLLSIKTGAVKTYVLLVGAVLIVLASGVILIKKYAM